MRWFLVLSIFFGGIRVMKDNKKNLFAELGAYLRTLKFSFPGLLIVICLLLVLSIFINFLVYAFMPKLLAHDFNSPSDYYVLLIFFIFISRGIFDFLAIIGDAFSHFFSRSASKN